MANVINATAKLFDGFKDEIAAHTIEIGYMFAVVGNNAFVYEPVFYWPDQWMPVQRRVPEQAHLAKLKEPPANAAASAAVHNINTALCKHFAVHGAAHFQVAKTYQYKAHHDPAAWALLEKIKSAVDSKRLVNPASLGLD